MNGSPNSLPRIAIPEPSSDPEYNQRTLSRYLHAIESAGGIPVLLALGDPPGAMAKQISTCRAVLLPGSRADVDPEKYGESPSTACHAKDGPREAADELLLQDAFNLAKPILGICYGAQSLNVWLNGTLIQDLPSVSEGSMEIDHRKSEHDVDVELDSALGAILAEAPDAGLVNMQAKMLRVPVNSSHHQAIREAGDRVRIVGRSFPDGVVEAVEAKRRYSSSASGQHYVIGVEWHPERSYDTSPISRLLFVSFVRAASSWQPRPVHTSVVS